jgi:hypothetical protein
MKRRGVLRGQLERQRPYHAELPGWRLLLAAAPRERPLSYDNGPAITTFGVIEQWTDNTLRNVDGSDGAAFGAHEARAAVCALGAMCGAQAIAARAKVSRRRASRCPEPMRARQDSEGQDRGPSPGAVRRRPCPHRGCPPCSGARQRSCSSV